MSRTEEIRAKRDSGKPASLYETRHLLERVERLEAGLKVIMAKGDDPNCYCSECLCARAVKKVAAQYLEESDGE